MRNPRLRRLLAAIPILATLLMIAPPALPAFAACPPEDRPCPTPVTHTTTTNNNDSDAGANNNNNSAQNNDNNNQAGAPFSGNSGDFNQFGVQSGDAYATYFGLGVNPKGHNLALGVHQVNDRRCLHEGAEINCEQNNVRPNWFHTTDDDWVTNGVAYDIAAPASQDSSATTSNTAQQQVATISVDGGSSQEICDSKPADVTISGTISGYSGDITLHYTSAIGNGYVSASGNGGTFKFTVKWPGLATDTDGNFVESSHSEAINISIDASAPIGDHFGDTSVTIGRSAGNCGSDEPAAPAMPTNHVGNGGV